MQQLALIASHSTDAPPLQPQPNPVAAGDNPGMPLPRAGTQQQQPTTPVTPATTTSIMPTATTTITVTMPSYAASGSSSMPGTAVNENSSAVASAVLSLGADAQGASPVARVAKDDPRVQRLVGQVAEGALQLDDMMSDETIEALAVLLASLDCKITWLRLSNVDHADITVLSEALKMNATLLAELDLQFNEIGDDGAIALSEALKVNATLAELDLKRNQIDDDGAAALSEALKVNRTLARLDLSSNKPGAAGLAALSKALQSNSVLVSLEIGCDKLDDDAFVALLEALKTNRTLQKLDLGVNKLQSIDEGFLLETLKANGTLSFFKIRSNNQCGDVRLTELIRPVLLENDAIRSALPYAALSLEFASNPDYPREIMNAITQQLAFLPPSKREEGRATIEALSAAIQPAVAKN